MALFVKISFLRYSLHFRKRLERATQGSHIEGCNRTNSLWHLTRLTSVVSLERQRVLRAYFRKHPRAMPQVWRKCKITFFLRVYFLRRLTVMTGHTLFILCQRHTFSTRAVIGPQAILWILCSIVEWKFSGIHMTASLSLSCHQGLKVNWNNYLLVTTVISWCSFVFWELGGWKENVR